MGTQSLTLEHAASATADSVAVLLTGPALAGGPSLAAHLCPTPLAFRRVGADVRPVPAGSGAPIRTRGLGAFGGASASGAFGSTAWMPNPAGVDQPTVTTVLSKYTSDFVTHHPGDRALRPPV